MLNVQDEKCDNLQGLLYIENLRNIRFDNDNQLTIIIRGFWSENVTSEEFLIDNKINLIESFSTIRNNSFLEKVINNHLLIELHQKDNKIIGIAKLPLHQYYIAFKDSEITNRLFQETLPVISIDDWVPVINPISNDCYGYLKSLLAMGTNEQINHLKEKRNLQTTTSNSSSLSSQHQNCYQSKNLINCDFTKISSKSSSLNDKLPTKQKYNGISSNHLGNFIENLIQKRNLNASLAKNVSNIGDNVKNIDSTETNLKKLQTRKTSDLLDALNKALSTPPTDNDLFSFCCFNQSQNSQSSLQSNNSSTIIQDISKTCKTLIEIDRAIDLPYNTMKICNKKISSKRSINNININTNNGNNNNKRKQSRFATEEEPPSSYVTFHALAGYGQMVKSHEGFVYSTQICEKNCNPIWSKKFEVPVLLDLFINNEKFFILKIWRKITTDLAQCRLQPQPMDDIVIGFLSINLNKLKTGDNINDWFNIIDHNGRINGRIKIKIETIDDIDNLKRKFNESLINNTLDENNINWITCNNSIDFNNTPLSRAIKRKFTELEEITERLKARLLGVTGDLNDEEYNCNNDCKLNNLDNINNDEKDLIFDEQLDEFEHDLNTVCEEDYDDNDWLLNIQQNKNDKEEKKEEIKFNQNKNENFLQIKFDNLNENIQKLQNNLISASEHNSNENNS